MAMGLAASVSGAAHSRWATDIFDGMGDDLKALPDLDLSVYTTLAGAYRSAAEMIWGNSEKRFAQLDLAETGWSGEARTAFAPIFQQGIDDAGELYVALHHAAAMVDGKREGRFADKLPDPGERNLLAAAKRENQRRQAARAWLEKKAQYEKDHPEQWYDPRDWFNSRKWEELIGPMPAKVPEPFLEAPPAKA